MLSDAGWYYHLLNLSPSNYQSQIEMPSFACLGVLSGDLSADLSAVALAKAEALAKAKHQSRKISFHTLLKCS
jgi:hypothetical protein